MGKYRRCFVCDNSTKNEVVLHKFPTKNSPYYRGWVEFCRRAVYFIREDDDFSSCFICSMHFEKDDYNFPKILKAGAVPSVIHMKKKSSFNNSLETKCVTNVATSSAPEPSFNCSPQTEGVTIYASSSAPEPIPPIATPTAETSNTSDEISSDCQAVKRKLSSPVMPSPKKAKLSLMLAKSTIEEKNKVIKMLRQKTRRLTNKIQSLKNLVNHLKMSALISEKEKLFWNRKYI